MNTLLQLVGLAPEHRDVITTGGQIVLAAIGLMTALVGYFLERLRREVKTGRAAQEETAENARLAAERSEPTGNGFAGEMRAAVARIEKGQERLETRQGRLEDHFYDHIAQTNRKD